MNRQFIESSDGIAYQDALAPAARILVLLMALAMFVVPIAFLMLAPWAKLEWSMLWLVLFVAPFTALGAVFTRLGLARAKRVFFDARTRSLRMDMQGPLGLQKLVSPFTAIEALSVERFKGLDDPDSFSLRLKLAHRRRPYLLGVFAQENDALDWLARIQSLLSPKGNPP
ncbi:MAG: hypothetical protein NVV60_03445 [Luteimonas sp.]|nr:hypothetical protein [Luteimonas sp.]